MLITGDDSVHGSEVVETCSRFDPAQCSYVKVGEFICSLSVVALWSCFCYNPFLSNLFSSLIVAASSWKKSQIKLQRPSGSSCRVKAIVCAKCS